MVLPEYHFKTTADLKKEIDSLEKNEDDGRLSRKKHYIMKEDSDE